MLKLPRQLNNSELFYVENSIVKKENIEKQSFLKNSKSSKAIYVEDNNLILVNYNQSKVLNPLGEGLYVWESFSNDGKKILFSYGNQGTFVCDLEGNILLNIKDARYPKFSPDGKYISYMNDKDNGYTYISSDIFVYFIDLDQSFKVTDTNDKIEMFAEWSNDGSRLVYNTTEGEIYITKLQFEN
jgi:Tol biopolymer transport system component